ncbi:protein toll [Elysia marginata]|uniref:Protein toll n=1 Tax=Elysia marginata TaxID=1093978 RepID=A0AAV4J8X6_9GAST|nr:protein toll [Elysia marginata]
MTRERFHAMVIWLLTCYAALQSVTAAPWLSVPAADPGQNKSSTSADQPASVEASLTSFLNGIGQVRNTGNVSSSDADETANSPVGMSFDFSANQGNSGGSFVKPEQDSSSASNATEVAEDKPPEPVGMSFDFSANQGNSGGSIVKPEQDSSSASNATEVAGDKPTPRIVFDFSANKGNFPADDKLWTKVEPDESDDWGDSFDDVDLYFDLDEDECTDSCEDFKDICSGNDKCEVLENCTAMCNKADGTRFVLYPKDLRPIEERRCAESGKICVHGKCQEDKSCACDVGYEGDLCDVKQCYLPCLHGTCYKYEVSENKVACACKPGWQGVLCNEEACTLPCARGSCLYRNGNITASAMFCNCPHGWTGKLCEKEIPDPAASAKTLALIVGITTPAVCIIVMIISWYILWRKRVIFVFKIINMFKAYEDDDDKLYDAYVSLTDADYVFVKHVLQPKLENMGHRLYLHARDGAAGEVKSEEILDAVKKSRRCIMLLSSDYVSNEWCRFEYLIAQHETCIKLKQRIIPILMDDIDKDKKKMDKTLRFIVDSVKCLRYPKQPQELLSPVPTSTTQLDPEKCKSKEVTKFKKKVDKFWERLRLNMPKKRSTPKEKCTLVPGDSNLFYSHQNTKKTGFGSLFSKLSNSMPVSSKIEKTSSTDFSFAEPTSSSEKFSEVNPVALISVTARVYPKINSFYSDTIERSVTTGDNSESSYVIAGEDMKGVATEDIGHVDFKL